MKICKVLFWLTLVMVLVMFCDHLTFAQTKAQFSWIPSTGTCGVTYNLYRAPCTGTVTNGVCPAASIGAYTKIASNIVAPPYTDVIATGGTYSYMMTASCSGYAESPPTAAQGVSFTYVPPPTNFALTSVSYSIQGSQETVVAKGTAPAGNVLGWTIGDGLGHVVSYGSTKALADGSYSVTSTYKKQLTPAAPVFTICDGTTCYTKTA